MPLAGPRARRGGWRYYVGLGVREGWRVACARAAPGDHLSARRPVCVCDCSGRVWSGPAAVGLRCWSFRGRNGVVSAGVVWSERAGSVVASRTRGSPCVSCIRTSPAGAFIALIRRHLCTPEEQCATVKTDGLRGRMTVGSNVCRRNVCRSIHWLPHLCLPRVAADRPQLDTRAAAREAHDFRHVLGPPVSTLTPHWHRQC